MIKLSYIIPVYNGEKTIGTTLDCILGQDIPEDEIEILVTDDCSRDNTVAVLEDYALRHPCIHVIRQDRNHRQGAARNRGLEVAKGEYITFVDADDSVMPGIAEALQKAMDTQVDVFCAKSLICRNPGTDREQTEVVKVITNLPVGKIYTGKEFCESVRDFCGNNGTPWGYLFHRSYVESTGRRYIEDHLFEETDWIAFHFYNARTVYYSDIVIYKYYINPESVMAGDMTFNYVADSSRLAVRMMKIADEFRSQSPDLVADWYRSADAGLLNKGVRWNYLVRYPFSDIRRYHAMLGKENVDYLKTHYKGDFFKTLMFNHRLLALTILFILRPLHLLQWKMRGLGPIKRNFYR